MNPSAIAPAASSSSLSSSSWLAGLVRGRSFNSAAGSGGGASSMLASDSLGPVSRKNQLHGVIYKYGPKPIQKWPSADGVDASHAGPARGDDASEAGPSAGNLVPHGGIDLSATSSTTVAAAAADAC